MLDLKLQVLHEQSDLALDQSDSTKRYDRAISIAQIRNITLKFFITIVTCSYLQPRHF